MGIVNYIARIVDNIALFQSASIEAVNPDDQKRYTRLEMAKILEQRDFYKEKFLEMQEDMRCIYLSSVIDTVG